MYYSRTPSFKVQYFLREDVTNNKDIFYHLNNGLQLQYGFPLSSFKPRVRRSPKAIEISRRLPKQTFTYTKINFISYEIRCTFDL